MYPKPVFWGKKEEETKSHLFLTKCAHSSLPWALSLFLEKIRGFSGVTPPPSYLLSVTVPQALWRHHTVFVCTMHMTHCTRGLLSSVLDASGMQNWTQPRWGAQENCDLAEQMSCVIKRRGASRVQNSSCGLTGCLRGRSLLLRAGFPIRTILSRKSHGSSLVLYPQDRVTITDTSLIQGLDSLEVARSFVKCLNVLPHRLEWCSR